MKLNRNRFCIVLVNICCLAVCSFSFYRLFFFNDFGNKSLFDINASASNGYEEYAVFSSASAEKNETAEKIVPANSDSVVLGKVLEKYISPYTANTSYKNIYLKNSTDLNVDIKSLFESNLSFNLKDNSAPQVLIINTHATESYLLQEKNFYDERDKSRTTDNTHNMIAIGEIVANKLNSNGINTIHDKTQHDYPSYNESYSRAAKTIISNLNKHPSIKVVIDLHRDSISTADNDKIKLTKVINGKKAAQIMLVMGSQSGNTKNFPNYKENLKLATKIQSKIEEKYKGLARSISLMPKNYNESLTTGSVLIEIGTDANTFEEAAYSAELLGNALSALFKEL